MPQDRNGKEIKVGDVVKGRFHTLSHEGIGPVLAVNESTAVNVTIGVVRVMTPMPGAMGMIYGGFAEQPVMLLQAGQDYASAADLEVIYEANPAPAIALPAPGPVVSLEGNAAGASAV